MHVKVEPGGQMTVFPFSVPSLEAACFIFWWVYLVLDPRFDSCFYPSVCFPVWPLWGELSQSFLPAPDFHSGPPAPPHLVLGLLWTRLIITWFPGPLVCLIFSLGVCLLPSQTVVPIRVRGEGEFRSFSLVVLYLEKLRSNVRSISTACAPVWLVACPKEVFSFLYHGVHLLWLR